MADFRRRGLTLGRRPPLAPQPPRIVEEEITPSSGWVENPEYHCLLIDLPGYTKNDIELSIDGSGNIVVKGKRRKGEDRQEHFEMTSNVPEDGDVKSISMEFDGITLRVRVPKVAKKANGEDKTPDEAPSSDIKEKYKKESNIPASRPSSPIKEDKAEESKSPPNITEEANIPPPGIDTSSSDTKDDTTISSLTEKGKQKEPESSDTSKETNGEAKSPDPSSYTNGITEEKAKIPPPSIDTSSGDTKDGTGLSSHAENGKQKEPEIPRKGDTTEKPNDRSQKKDSLGQPEKSSKTSVVGKIVENKGILLASIISFTLGVLLSQKFHPPPPQ